MNIFHGKYFIYINIIYSFIYFYEQCIEQPQVTRGTPSLLQSFSAAWYIYTKINKNVEQNNEMLGN